MNNKRCVLCPFVCMNSTALYHHSQQSHDGDERLKICCSVQGCRFSRNSFRKIRVHFSRKHQMSIRDAYTRVKFRLQVQDEENQEDESDEELDAAQMNRKVGKVVIDLETRHHIGGTGGNFVVEKVKEVLNIVTRRNDEDFFKPISTVARRATFYKRNFFLVKPKPILLGSGVKTIRGKSRRFRHNGYFVPFEEQLRALMNLPEFKKFCNATRGPRDPNVFDGIYRTLEGEELKTIFVSLSFDELEIVNVIGYAKKVHKLFICLWDCLNVDPEFRSGLESKFMMFMGHNKYIRKYGTQLILSDFIRTVKRSQNGGLNLDETQDRYRIELAFSTSDWPASNVIFGFKESLGKTFRFCRLCRITRDELCTTFDCRNFDLRTKEQHQENLAELATLEGAERKEYQRYTGIVASTPMATQVPGCSIEKALVDVFHTILEGGVLAIPLQFFLRQIVEVDQILTLKELNAIIQNWSFWEGDKTDKIPVLDEKFLETGRKMNMKGASVYILAQELCFMLADFIDPTYPYLENFVRILQLSQAILFAPSWSLDSIGEMREEFSIHHFEFLKLYRIKSLTPKFHLILHAFRQIERFGASRYHSTIRFESKYSVIKSEKLKNFINPAKSLSMFHQKFQAQHMVDNEGNVNENFYKSKMQVSSVSAFSLERVPNVYQELTAEFNFTKMCHKISFGNVSYENGTFLERTQPYEMDPVFICIECIFLDNNEDAYLGVKMYRNVEFSDYLCAFLCKDFENVILPFSSLPYRLLLPHRIYDNNLYVIRKHTSRFQPLV